MSVISATQAPDRSVPPAESVRIRVYRPRLSSLGSWARASWVVVMWSFAVLEPALPGRSSAATGSPEPAWPWSTNATGGWMMTEGLPPRRGGVLLLGVREDQHAVDVHDHAVVGGRSVFTGQRPDPRAYFGSRRADHSERSRP